MAAPKGEADMKRLIGGAWVVVADEEKALVLRNVGDAFAPVLELVERIDNLVVSAMDERSARLHDHKHHATIEPPRYHRLAAATLADLVAAHLLEAKTAGLIEALVLVAPAQVLGALRHALDGQFVSEMVAEFARTMTEVPTTSIMAVLERDLSQM
jgi:protein required for attachment to host cells